MSRWRITAWIIAALILLLPLVAMSFTEEVNWTLSDFVFAGVLLFGALGVYEGAARSTDNTAYRGGVGLALLTAVLLTWINGAVGITDGAADGLYLGVPILGIIGALIARFRPRGMARAMVAAASAQALIGGIALIAGMVPAHNSAFEILGITGFFVALWVGSAGLFRKAARGRSGSDAT